VFITKEKETGDGGIYIWRDKLRGEKRKEEGQGRKGNKKKNKRKSPQATAR